jgi:hypothetical protein
MNWNTGQCSPVISNFFNGANLQIILDVIYGYIPSNTTITVIQLVFISSYMFRPVCNGHLVYNLVSCNIVILYVKHLVQKPEVCHYKLAETCSEINASWKTVIVVLDGIYPYITFMIIQNTMGMYHSNMKILNNFSFPDDPLPTNTEKNKQFVA